jgi:hypothetical protein
MEVHEIENILHIFDEISQVEDGAELVELVSHVKYKLNGNLPSIIIKELFVITDEKIKSLQFEKEELQSRIEHISHNGKYDFKDFLAALQIKTGRTYGWKTDYIKASENTDNCKKVSNEDFTKWIKNQLVPDWVYDQIQTLNFPKRIGSPAKEWTNHEYEFLVKIHIDDSSRKNIVLAHICSEKFGRDITENAIKGSLDRLRKQNRIPQKRPKKS